MSRKTSPHSKIAPQRQFVVSGTFHGFTNTSYNAMYFDHSANGRTDSCTNWIPAMIKVDDEDLRNLLKQLPKKTKVEVTLERGTDHTGLYAKLISIRF